jgi:uncharacterized protein YkwD
MGFKRRVVGVAIALLLLTATGGFTPKPAAAGVSFDTALYNLINQDRSQNGLPPLQWSGALSGVGENTPYGGCGYTIYGRAEDMGNRNYFAHLIPNCGSQYVFNMENNEGIHFASAGENIGWASGFTDPVQAANYFNTAYMNSPDHRANILNPNYTEVGVGSWQAGPGQTWSNGSGSFSNVFISSEEFAQNSGTASPLPVTCPPKGQWCRITWGIGTALRTG